MEIGKEGREGGRKGGGKEGRWREGGGKECASSISQVAMGVSTELPHPSICPTHLLI